jgi:hypothetical protein
LAGKPKYSEKTYPSAALSTNNPTCCPHANPGRRDGKSATNRLSYGTALLLLLHCPYSPLLGLDRFFSFFVLYTAGRIPWTGDQSVARPLPTHRTTQTQNKRTQYRHPCLERVSNPRSQLSTERKQFMPQTARPL